MIFTGIKRIVYLSLPLFFIFAFSGKIGKLSNDDILLRSRYSLLKINNLQYRCEFSQKFAGGRDTLKTNATILLERKNTDTILGCDMKMTSRFKFFAMSFETELFYNGKKNISLNHTRKRATIDTIGPRGQGKPTMSLLKQNFPSAELMNHYTENLPYEPFFKKGNKVSALPDQRIGEYVCYHLRIVSKDPDRKKRITHLFIDKESFFPIRRMDSVDFTAKYQFSDFTLSEIKTNDSKTLRKITPPAIPKGYGVDYYRLDRY
jgi:hypothetical protein